MGSPPCPIENRADQNQTAIDCSLILSSAVFGENQRYCYSLGIGVVMVVQKLLTFCNISVITKDIY